MENEAVKYVTQEEFISSIRAYLSLAVSVFFIGVGAITLLAGFLQNILNRRRIQEEAQDIFQKESVKFEERLNELRSDAMYSLALGFGSDQNYAAAFEYYIYASYYYSQIGDFISAKTALERAERRVYSDEMEDVSISVKKMSKIATTMDNLRTDYPEEIGEDLLNSIQQGFVNKFSLSAI
jgi:hypothetical protein